MPRGTKVKIMKCVSLLRAYTLELLNVECLQATTGRKVLRWAVRQAATVQVLPRKPGQLGRKGRAPVLVALPALRAARQTLISRKRY
jgi:hypothetical protein